MFFKINWLGITSTKDTDVRRNNSYGVRARTLFSQVYCNEEEVYLYKNVILIFCSPDKKEVRSTLLTYSFWSVEC